MNPGVILVEKQEEEVNNYLRNQTMIHLFVRNCKSSVKKKPDRGTTRAEYPKRLSLLSFRSNTLI